MRMIISVLVATASLLLGATGVARAGQAAQPAPPAPANDDCAACHGDPGFTRANGTSVSVDMPGFSASKHGAISCVDCHSDLAALTEYPHAEQLKRATCATCHVDIGASYTDSIHGRARERSGLNVAPSCTNCHGSHDIKSRIDPGSRVAHAQVSVTCGTCHDGITARYDAGVHAAAMRKGDARAPSCATCHTAHDITRVDTEAARLSVTAECGTCHASVVESFGRTFHGKVTQLGSGRVAACADCHSAHEVLPASNAASTVARHNLPVTCGKCHQGASPSFVEYDPHPNPSDYHRSAALWWANRFYWLLIPGCFGFFGLHSLLWLWRATRAAPVRKEPSR
jgi:hypothetical protein